MFTKMNCRKCSKEMEVLTESLVDPKETLDCQECWEREGIYEPFDSIKSEIPMTDEIREGAFI